MATKQRQTFDGAGNLLQTETLPYPDEEANADTMRESLRGAVARIRTISTTASYPNNAQRDAAIQDLARAILRLGRLFLNETSGSAD